MDETAIPTNANEQIAALREGLHRERAESGRLHRDVEMVVSAAGGGDLFSVADRLHAAHKQIHALRLMLTQDSVRSYSDDNWTDEEIDEAVGVEPRCAACHGFGPGSGQAPIPVELAVYDTTHAKLLTPDKLAQVDKVLRDVGLKLMHKVEEES